MIIGKLNRVIEIWQEQPSKTLFDELGTSKLVPVKIKSVYASMVPQTGSLLNNRAGGTLLSKSTHKIIIRHSAFPELSNKYFIIYKNHRFQIDYVLNPNMKNESLEVFCEELI